jgi:hypothetical protein
MPVILAILDTQETEINRITVPKPAPANSSRDYLEKNNHKKGLAEWLKR